MFYVSSEVVKAAEVNCITNSWAKASVSGFSPSVPNAHNLFKLGRKPIRVAAKKRCVKGFAVMHHGWRNEVNHHEHSLLRDGGMWWELHQMHQG